MTSEELRETRTSLGLSQIALAAAIGITQQAISRWEKGLAPVPLWAVKALARMKKGK